jgi:hypothetical protein
MRVKDKNHLYALLLPCIDMYVNNMIVTNQTTRQEVYFNERLLKFNPDGHTLMHRGEVEFDPLNNFKQTQIMFSIFLKMQEEDEGLYTQIFYDEKDPQDEFRTRMFMRTNQGNFASQYYYNISLGSIEMILALSGIVVENLVEFDSAPPVMDEEKKTRRRILFPQRDLL